MEDQVQQAWKHDIERKPLMWFVSEIEAVRLLGVKLEFLVLKFAL